RSQNRASEILLVDIGLAEGVGSGQFRGVGNLTANCKRLHLSAALRHPLGGRRMTESSFRTETSRIRSASFQAGATHARPREGRSTQTEGSEMRMFANRSTTIRFLLVTVAALVLVCPAFAQYGSQGKVNVTVLDPSKKVVQGARLELEDLSTNTARHAVTSD